MSSPQPNIPLSLRPDHPQPAHHTRKAVLWETCVSLGLMAVGGLMAWGAKDIPAEAGYDGVGANFLPWVVAVALMLCGAVLLWHARTGGFRGMEETAGVERPDWIGFVWVSAGLLLNAALIERIGFVLGCALAYVLAVQGLKRAYGKPYNTWVVDIISGLAIAAPVYWLFTKLLAINLPGLTGSGWL